MLARIQILQIHTENLFYSTTKGSFYDIYVKDNICEKQLLKPFGSIHHTSLICERLQISQIHLGTDVHKENTLSRVSIFSVYIDVGLCI